jgi:hypothetical protein
LLIPLDLSIRLADEHDKRHRVVLLPEEPLLDTLGLLWNVAQHLANLEVTAIYKILACCTLALKLLDTPCLKLKEGKVTIHTTQHHQPL